MLGPAALLLALHWGCGEPEPVLRGVGPEPLLGAPAPAPASADTQPKPYERPPGVLVDIQYLTSRPLIESRAVLRDQLGSLVQAEQLRSGWGERLTLERGAVQVLEGRVYMIEFPLPEPMRRDQAMRALGLPPQVNESIPTHRQYRLNNERGFRRILMERQSRRNELVVSIQAWKWLPGEHQNRR
jgi:hypothetical protein